MMQPHEFQAVHPAFHGDLLSGGGRASSRGTQQFRQAMKLVGADHQLDMRESRRQFLAEPLRHATEDRDHQPRLALRQPSEQPQLAQHLSFSLIADAASVIEQHVRCFLAGSRQQSLGLQQTGDRLRVALVHLATVGAQKIAAGLGGGIGWHGS